MHFHSSQSNRADLVYDGDDDREPFARQWELIFSFAIRFELHENENRRTKLLKCSF